MNPSDPAIRRVIAEINKAHGPGTAQVLGDVPPERVEVLPTGSLNLDVALRIGGWPRGRIVEVFGPAQSGKTLLGLTALAQVQAIERRGPSEGELPPVSAVAYIDGKHDFDPLYAAALGVDPARLLVSQPDTCEQAMDIVEALARSGVVQLVVLDEVTTLPATAETLDAPDVPSVVPRVMSKAMRKLVFAAYRSGCTVLLLNTVEARTGVTFGPTEVVLGGNAAKYYASVRVHLRRTSGGSAIDARVVKNKLAPPFTSTAVPLREGRIDHGSEVLSCAQAHGVLDGADGWWSFRGRKLGAGYPSIIEALDADTALCGDILAACVEAAAAAS